jgi:hypothetical protein
MKKLARVFFLFAVHLCFLLGTARGQIPYPTRAATYGDGAPIQLLYDIAFANGFRAGFSCKTFDGHPLFGLGNCREYWPPIINPHINNYVIRTWPDTAQANWYSDENKYWHFNEGVHRGVIVDGYNIPSDRDLAVHRFEANAASYVGDGIIWLQHTNNLSPSNPRYGHVVRAAQSNRNGTLLTWANTQNEIRNVATNHGPLYGNDTWPHYYVDQSFKEFIDLATFEQVFLTMNLQIWPVTLIPNNLGTELENAVYNIQFILARKDNPYVVFFLKYCPYSIHARTSQPPEYEENLGVDQWQAGIYRGNVWDIGGPSVPNASSRTITIELRSVMNKAIAAAAAAGQNLGPLDDWYLSNVSFGWEVMGYAEIQSQVSNVSLLGHPRMMFDAAIYQDDHYSGYPDLPWTGDAAASQRRAHWVKYGIHEGRVASPHFSAPVYLARYPDVAAVYGATNYAGAVHHYVVYGRGEGRSGAP